MNISDRQDNSRTVEYIQQKVDQYSSRKDKHIYQTDKITAGQMNISDRQDNSRTDKYIRRQDNSWTVEYIQQKDNIAAGMINIYIRQTR